MPITPEGYSIVKDRKYIIQDTDRYFVKIWPNTFSPVPFHSFYTKMVGKQLGDAEDDCESLDGVIIYSKNKPKPRFVCDKPYPYGY